MECVKTGLVVEGGGMRGVYGSGVLDAFMDAGIDFEYSVGTSAGAANIISFAAKQRGRNYRFYMDHLIDNPNNVGVKSFVKNGQFFNFDYIYGKLSLEDDPVDFETLFSNPNEAEYVACDAYTASPHYFSIDDISSTNCDALRASCAVPGYCEPVKVGDGLYFDGGVVDSIPVARAVSMGCDRVVVVLSRPLGYRKKPQIMKAVYRMRVRKYPRVIKAIETRHENYNRTIAYIEALQAQGRAIVVAPSRNVDVSLTCQDKALMNEFYIVGLEDGREATAKILEQGWMRDEAGVRI